MNPKALSLSDWPEIDHIAWTTAIKAGDRFDGRGRVAHWSPASRNSIGYAYGRWLGFIKRFYPGLLSESPESRFTHKLVQDYVYHLQSEVNAATVYIYFDHLMCAVQAMLPGSAWGWFKSILRHLRRDIRPRVKQHRLVDSDRLIALGIELMDKAEVNINRDKDTDPVTGRYLLDELIQYRDGLLVTILAIRPVRRRTLSLIRIGKQLQKVGHHYHLIFGSADTKNRKPLEYALPALLTGYLDRYIKTYRRLIPGSEKHDSLWASAKGNPLSSGSIYRRIMKRTTIAFGIGISPHLFRDCAATTLATYCPEQVLLGAALLGHSDLRSIHNHYIHAQTMKAGKAYQNTIAALRGTTPRGSR